MSEEAENLKIGNKVGQKERCRFEKGTKIVEQLDIRKKYKGLSDWVIIEKIVVPLIAVF